MPFSAAAPLATLRRRRRSSFADVSRSLQLLRRRRWFATVNRSSALTPSCPWASRALFRRSPTTTENANPSELARMNTRSGLLWTTRWFEGAKEWRAEHAREECCGWYLSFYDGRSCHGHQGFGTVLDIYTVYSLTKIGLRQFTSARHVMASRFSLILWGAVGL